MAGVLSEDRDGIRLVFHHMPLTIHSWARSAAEGAACAQMQNNEAFWSLHDQLFEHQSELDAANIKERLLQYAGGINTLNFASFKSCIDDQMSLGLLFRDANLAAATGVDATPTIFINGRRIAGVKDADQLRRLIAEAKLEAHKQWGFSPSLRSSQPGGDQ